MYSKSININERPFDDAKMLDDLADFAKTVHIRDKAIDKFPSDDTKIVPDLAAISKCHESVDDIINNYQLKKTIFDFDFSIPNDHENGFKMFFCLLSLSTNTERTVEPCHIREYVSERAAQHIQNIMILNQKNSKYLFNLQYDANIGFHIPLFASLINHACYSNAFCITLDNKVFTIIHKPVRCGEQITVKYS